MDVKRGLTQWEHTRCSPYVPCGSAKMVMRTCICALFDRVGGRSVKLCMVHTSPHHNHMATWDNHLAHTTCTCHPLYVSSEIVLSFPSTRPRGKCLVNERQNQ